MKHKRKFNGKQIVIKTATVGLLLNMLMNPVIPALAEAGKTPVTTEGAATTTETAPKTNAVKIPSVESLNLELSSAILIEPTTGQVLMALNPDTPLPPASMTKMMTEYLVSDAVKKETSLGIRKLSFKRMLPNRSDHEFFWQMEMNIRLKSYT